MAVVAKGPNGFTASWTNPEQAAGVQVTSGQLKYSPAGGPEVPVDITLTSGEMTKDVTGLEAGTTYSVDVCLCTAPSVCACAGAKDVTTDEAASGGKPHLRVT